VGFAQELQAQGCRQGRRWLQLPWPEAKNDTHASTSDPDAKLYRKATGREARLSYMGHAVMENRHSLAVAGTVSQADGTAERRASVNPRRFLSRLLEAIAAQREAASSTSSPHDLSVGPRNCDQISRHELMRRH
jgi:hypothetical protein